MALWGEKGARTSRPHDGGDPLIEVVALGSCAAVRGRLQRDFRELLLDALRRRAHRSSFRHRADLSPRVALPRFAARAHNACGRPCKSENNDRISSSIYFFEILTCFPLQSLAS